jgi:hypothetical protein
MKRILILLLVVLATNFAQAQTVVNRSGAANTVADYRLQASYNFYGPRYADTAAANAANRLGIDSASAIIYTYDVQDYWYRQHSPKKWVRFGAKAVTVVGADVDTSGRIYYPGYGIVAVNDSVFRADTAALATLWDLNVVQTGVNNLADTSGRIYYTGFGLTAPTDSTFAADTTQLATIWDITQLSFPDTSGRTYYAVNGLSARNDSTFKLGGYLDEATRIKGLNTHFVVWDSLSGNYVNTYYAGYKIEATQQDYFELKQTHLASGEVRNRFYWNTSRMYFENLSGQYSFKNLTTKASTGVRSLLAVDENDLLFKPESFPEYADQAAAVAAGLANGAIYHTAGVLKVVYGVLPP